MRTMVLLALLAAPVSAQELTIDATPVAGSIGWTAGSGWGIEIGAGPEQIRETLSPGSAATGDPDFNEYAHVALFRRVKPSARFEVDAGVRAGFAELFTCTASDCWPSRFLGAYVQPMVGWRRVKFGVRLTSGWIHEREEGQPAGWTGVVAMTPLLVRYTIPL